MASAVFRFYEELNDFLPPARRKRDLRLAFTPPAPVRHLIETLGVPHTEVELILINGESAGLDQRVADGDRVSVYPMFESLDISPLLRIRRRPLREPRFVADAHLGKLAHYLRMLGFDTLLASDCPDRELAAIAAAQHRILLTRDRALLMRRIVTHGCYVRARRPLGQLEDIVRRLDLCRCIRPFSRCMRCNGDLEAVAKADVEHRLPDDARRIFSEFWRCAGCGQVYWKGGHYQRMRRLVERICSH
ncbi:MAG TPA: twitching motility protein PilT [Sedimenticola sp.]|nr:twitching motility protein PilT [Sedimenticola sp.]